MDAPKSPFLAQIAVFWCHFAMKRSQNQQGSSEGRKKAWPGRTLAGDGLPKAPRISRTILRAQAAATPLGAASPFYNAAAPPRARVHPAPPVRHYFGKPLAAAPTNVRTTHAAAPAPRVVRTGGLKRAEAKQADPATPPLGQLVHDPAAFYCANRDADGGYSESQVRGGSHTEGAGHAGPAEGSCTAGAAVSLRNNCWSFSHLGSRASSPRLIQRALSPSLAALCRRAASPADAGVTACLAAQAWRHAVLTAGMAGRT